MVCEDVWWCMGDVMSFPIQNNQKQILGYQEGYDKANGWDHDKATICIHPEIHTNIHTYIHTYEGHSKSSRNGGIALQW